MFLFIIFYKNPKVPKLLIYKYSPRKVSDYSHSINISQKYQLHLNWATCLDSKYITKSKITKYTDIQAQTVRSIKSKVILQTYFKYFNPAHALINIF